MNPAPSECSTLKPPNFAAQGSCSAWSWVHHGPLQGLLSTSLLRSSVGNMLEACQPVRVRYYAVLQIEVPRCRKVCNDFCGGGGTAFLEGRIRRPVIFKPDAHELRSRI